MKIWWVPETSSGFIKLRKINFTILIKGTTGFDSKDSEFVSIPSYEITLVKPNFNFLNGEDNYALAA